MVLWLAQDFIFLQHAVDLPVDPIRAGIHFYHMHSIFVFKSCRYTPCVHAGKTSAVFKLAAFYDFSRRRRDHERWTAGSFAIDHQIGDMFVSAPDDF